MMQVFECHALCFVFVGIGRLALFRNSKNYLKICKRGYPYKIKFKIIFLIPLVFKFI